MLLLFPIAQKTNSLVMLRRTVLLLFATMLCTIQISCTTVPAIPIDTNPTIEPANHERHLRIVAIGDVPEPRMADISTTLTRHRPLLLNWLELEALPEVSVVVWQNRDEFEAAYGDNASNVRGFIDATAWEVHIFNTRRSPAYSALHEMVHLASLALNPNISHNPRWLWETTAIYASRRPPPPKLASVTCITADAVPSFTALDNHPSNIYRVGYYLGEFIVSNWGWRGMRALIENNGRIRAGLGVSIEEFKQQWLAHMASSYTLYEGSRQSDC
jgi:hypothetical protein